MRIADEALRFVEAQMSVENFMDLIINLHLVSENSLKKYFFVFFSKVFVDLDVRWRLCTVVIFKKNLGLSFII
jgi:hypothetical protein